MNYEEFIKDYIIDCMDAPSRLKALAEYMIENGELKDLFEELCNGEGYDEMKYQHGK